MNHCCFVYCDFCERAYSTQYLGRHIETDKHRFNLLMSENAPRLSRKESDEIMDEDYHTLDENTVVDIINAD